MASDCLGSDFIDSDLFYWAHSHIDEAAITGRVDDTIEEEREELMKKYVTSTIRKLLHEALNAHSMNYWYPLLGASNTLLSGMMTRSSSLSRSETTPSASRFSLDSPLTLLKK